MSFQPHAGERIAIDDVVYRVAAHPASAWAAYGQEGRQGTVYQLLRAEARDGAATESLALKVFKARYRTPSLVTVAERSLRFAGLPGLLVCRRTVLGALRHAPLLRRFPDLAYAVLMPWVAGPTWQEVVLSQTALDRGQCARLARALATVLARMEEEGLAHGDLAAANVLLPALAEPAARSAGVELVDLEQLYGPGLPRPAALPGGSPGYAHRLADAGLWSADGDRFAGSVLLAELLGWCDPRVRSAACSESYFAAEELQRGCSRYDVLQDVIDEHWGAQAAALLARAWGSDSLADCPTFGEWLIALPEPAVPVDTRTVAPGAFAAPFIPEPAPAAEDRSSLTNRAAPDGRRGARTAPLEEGAAAGGRRIREDASAGDDLAALFAAGAHAYAAGDWTAAQELLAAVVRRQPTFRHDGQEAAALLAAATRAIQGPAQQQRRGAWPWLVPLLMLLIAAAALATAGARAWAATRIDGIAAARTTRVAAATVAPVATPSLLPVAWQARTAASTAVRAATAPLSAAATPRAVALATVAATGTPTAAPSSTATATAPTATPTAMPRPPTVTPLPPTFTAAPLLLLAAPDTPPSAATATPLPPTATPLPPTRAPPTATSAPPPTPTATSTPIPPTATSLPAAPACADPPIRGFGLVWSNHPDVAASVGCPTQREVNAAVTIQRFQHGWMLRLSNQSPAAIFVLFEDNGAYLATPDAWVAGRDPVSLGLTPPPGLQEPRQAFGMVWRDSTGAQVQQRLGWATAASSAELGAWQPDQRGQMLWTPAPKVIFVLVNGTWRKYADTFVG